MKTLTIASLFVGSVLLAAGMGYNMPSFSHFDANNNGKITQTEFEQGQQQRMQKQAEAGKMMRNAGNAPMFDEIDSDGNGYIDKTEFATHQKNRKK